MKNISEKGMAHIVPILIVLAISGLVIWFFLNRSGLEPSGMKVQITPSQLMPFVSAQETRKTICNLKKDGLFAEACQNKFDVVGKEDTEKITELLVLLDKIKNDKNISDYERLLLSHAVFAALPIGNNPESSIYQPSLLSRLRDYFTRQITIYAQEKTMSEEEFKELMKKDLQNMVDGLPKGDNAWVINMMVSKYSWKDGKSRPLYSHQYGESFDPFPNNPDSNTKDINYNIRSVMGSKASGQTVDSEMLAYSFTIMSWNSKEYTSKDGVVDEKFLVRKRNHSDSSYQGEPYLNNLLEAVKLPSTKRSIESSDKKEPGTNGQTNTPKEITCEEWKRLAGSKGCRQWVSDGISSGLWCADTTEELYRSTDQGIELLIDSRPPDYTLSFNHETCLITKENYERNN